MLTSVWFVKSTTLQTKTRSGTVHGQYHSEPFGTIYGQYLRSHTLNKGQVWRWNFTNYVKVLCKVCQEVNKM